MHVRGRLGFAIDRRRPRPRQYARHVRVERHRTHLAGADLETRLGVFLHSDKDFEHWRRQFDECMAGCTTR